MSESKIPFPWFSVIITLLLCVLKLTGVISISWWWCFCLVWLPFALIFAVIGICFIVLIATILIGLIIELIETLKQ